MTERKAASVVLKAADGTGRAVIATFGVVDKDGDVTLPGAFPAGKEIVISAYGHTSWDGALPIGKGIVGADANEAWVDFELFLSTPQGQAAYETLKALGALAEWSYGFRVTKSDTATTDPELLAKYQGAWRVIHEVDPYEASPVLLGAGVNTRTESIKGHVPFAAEAEHVLADVQAFTARAKSLADLRAKDGRGLSDANRALLKGLLEALDAFGSARDEVRALLAATEPKSADDPRALLVIAEANASRIQGYFAN